MSISQNSWPRVDPLGSLRYNPDCDRCHEGHLNNGVLCRCVVEDFSKEETFSPSLVLYSRKPTIIVDFVFFEEENLRAPDAGNMEVLAENNRCMSYSTALAKMFELEVKETLPVTQDKALWGFITKEGQGWSLRKYDSKVFEEKKDSNQIVPDYLNF